MASEMHVTFVSSSEARVDVRNMRAGNPADSRATPASREHGACPGLPLTPQTLGLRTPRATSSGVSSNSGSDGPLENTVINIDDSLPLAPLAPKPSAAPGVVAGSPEDEAPGDVVPEVPDVVAEPPEGSSPAVVAEPRGSSPAAEASQCFAGADTVLWQGVITERRV